MTSPAAPPTRRRAKGDSRHGPLPALLLALTAVTGIVDAVSILRLGRVFVANMTGNVVFTGFALTGAAGFSLSASLSALAGFLAGAAVGGVFTRRADRDRALLLLAAVIAELALLAAALTVTATASTTIPAGTRDALAALLALAMGIQNAAARKLAVPDLTTTVLTMTLTGIAADQRTADHGRVLSRRLLAVTTMLGGAAVGAWLVLNVSAAAALGLAVGLVAAVTAAAAIATRHAAPWRERAQPAAGKPG